MVWRAARLPHASRVDFGSLYLCLSVGLSRLLELAEDELARDQVGLVALGGSCVTATQGGDQVSLLGGHGLDVVGVVVGSVAGEVGAAGDGGLDLGLELADGEDLLDAVDVGGVDDGRDIKVGQIVPALEGDLAKHTGVVGGALGDGEVVALPALGDGDHLLSIAVDLDGVDRGEAGVGSEDDGLGGGVLVPESDGVGCAGQAGSSSDKSGKVGSETHLGYMK